jgi:hypothetical protein
MTWRKNMSIASKPLVQITDSETQQIRLSTRSPRKIEIQNGFGAVKHRCWLELYNEDASTAPGLGDIMQVWINDTLCFKGRITQKRIDSIDDQLSFYAERSPEKDWDQLVNRPSADQTIPEILQTILADSNLQLASLPNQTTVFSHVTFGSERLFACMDYLAKLAGNWLWDVDCQGTVSFREHNTRPDHLVPLQDDRFTINIWESTNDLFSVVELHGGITGETMLRKIIEFPELAGIPETPYTRVFIRPVTTADAFSALEKAIREHMAHPHFEHYVDLKEDGEKIQAGQTVRFLVNSMPLFPEDRVFRVKTRSLTYAHESYKTRLYLTSGLESAPTYFYYFKNEGLVPRSYLEGRVGAFRLDASILDTQAHIDAT